MFHYEDLANRSCCLARAHPATRIAFGSCSVVRILRKSLVTRRCGAWSPSISPATRRTRTAGSFNALKERYDTVSTGFSPPAPRSRPSDRTAVFRAFFFGSPVRSASRCSDSVSHKWKSTAAQPRRMRQRGGPFQPGPREGVADLNQLEDILVEVAPVNLADELFTFGHYFS